MTEKKYRVKQIYYSNWSEKLNEGHETYWQTLPLIAEWIGNSLESCRRLAGHKPCWVSTIGVSQTKEKFGQVRVYCYFAMESAVSKKYKRLKKKIKKQNEGYYKWLKTNQCSPWIKKKYESGEYPIEIPDISEFTKECYFKDLKYYRSVYFDAFKLWPQYEKAIRSGADLFEYLFETNKDLDEYYNNLINEQILYFKKGPQWTEEGEENIINNLTRRKEEIKNTYVFLNNMEE
jgi:hypothetical protein